MESQYYFLFIFWDMFEFIIIYFFFVETRRRTLEEISEIFNAQKPVQHSLNKTRIIMHGNGRGVTEMLDKEEVVVVERSSGFGERESFSFEDVREGNGRRERDSAGSEGGLMARDSLRERVMGEGLGGGWGDTQGYYMSK